jgi:hypothetical protein
VDAFMTGRLYGAGRYAVGAIRKTETHNALDDFPTPPWATRALCEHVIVASGTVLEPATGRGFMSRPLAEYFHSVTESDTESYGRDIAVIDFLKPESYPAGSFDWVITNPPFNLAAPFIRRANEVARIGSAMLCRVPILEGVKRYTEIYRHNPPTIVAPFVERVPMVMGRCDPNASTATAYAWLVWEKQPKITGTTRLMWIPPCRKTLERSADYDLPAAWRAQRPRKSKRVRASRQVFRRPPAVRPDLKHDARVRSV